MKLGDAYKTAPLSENFPSNAQITNWMNKRKRCDDCASDCVKHLPLESHDMERDVLEEMGLSIIEDELDVRKSEVSLDGVEEVVSLVCNGDAPVCEASGKQGVKPAPPDSFFLYRRKRQESSGGDCFSCLSDELVLMVFKHLPKRALVRCALVCRRWRRVAYDETLWARLDLGLRTVRPGSLSHVLSRGVTTLRLAQAELIEPVFLNDNLYPVRKCKLQFLDLSMAVISDRGLAELLQACRQLQKLSLERCALTDEVCAALGANHGLEVLNLSSCAGLSTAGLTLLLTGCRKLSALNVAWTGLSEEALSCLCLKLPSSVHRLNISGCRKNLSDKHVADLVVTCPGLTELDVSDCTSLTPDAIDHVCKLPRLEHLAASRCYSIPPATFLSLSSVGSLLYLDVLGMMGDKCLAALQTHLSRVEVNKFLFSAVARPTVGSKRTSIWNLRVRDC
ncbi:S-phase kinase-associated protein 2 isoform X2 [Bacillus rossius redtenbacheri]|uniref:S-phase kinase-associated protein 2 isoform X2 n=1 Tax=Bacillus rossius redtenbacheri TaxID=93214 RepID=UPI002FDE50F8